MKKILLALCIACAVNPTMAQTNNDVRSGGSRQTHATMNPGERARKHTDKLQQKLNLTTDQYTKILAVNTEVIKRRVALKAQNGERDKAALKAIGAYRREQFAAILSPAQLEQLKAFRAEQKAKHKQRMGMKKQGQHPATDVPSKSEVPAAQQ